VGLNFLSCLKEELYFIKDFFLSESLLCLPLFIDFLYKGPTYCLFSCLVFFDSLLELLGALKNVKTYSAST
jgi:hypothetical protein